VVAIISQAISAFSEV